MISMVTITMMRILDLILSGLRSMMMYMSKHLVTPQEVQRVQFKMGRLIIVRSILAAIGATREEEVPCPRVAEEGFRVAS